MADQAFAVNCGFFDSVDKDRLYSADEMNRPYKRVITNGVFATQSGTPSTDLQVLAQSNNMNIIVSTGEGLFGDKWFQNPTQLSITVPENTNIVARRDSVIAQIDKRQTGRVGNIVYRTGTPSTTPVAPAINQVTNVIEYRIADIYVPANATAITQANITDKRGSSECPWITSLITQVDTSTLFNQWENAYEKFFADSTADFASWSAAKKAAFEEWLATLTEQLSVATNIIIMNHDYVSNDIVTTIPIGIASFDKSTDALMVFVNGLKVTEGENYTIDADSETITLSVELLAGQTVNFYVLKSVIGSDVATTATMIQALQDDVNDMKEVTDMVESVNYVGSGVGDNVKLCEMVQTFLSGGSDFRKLEIKVHGVFSVANTFVEENYVGVWFDFGDSTSNRRVIVDFADCQRIEIDNTLFTNVVGMKVYNSEIRNMQLVLNNCTNATMVSGNGSFYNCEFFVNGDGNLVGASEGEFVDCEIHTNGETGSSYCISGDGHVLRLINSRFVAVNLATASTEAVAVQVQSDESENVLIMSGCSCPVVVIDNYKQDEVVKVNDGFYCLTGNMLGKAGSFYDTGDGMTEVGTMIVSK